MLQFHPWRDTPTSLMMSKSHPPTYYSLGSVLYFMNSHFEGLNHPEYVRAAIRDDVTAVI